MVFCLGIAIGIVIGAAAVILWALAAAGKGRERRATKNQGDDRDGTNNV